MASKWSILFFIVMVAATFHSSAAQRTHVVGDALWIVPPPVNFSSWASGQTFRVGDILVFNFTTGRHDVAEVTSAEYDACSSQTPISISNTGPTNITLSSAGQHFYICAFPGHCDSGQKMAINVLDATSITPTSQPTPSSPAPAPTPVPASPTPSPAAYVVGEALGWTVPPGDTTAYQVWASNKTFLVGDTLVFNFTIGRHDVVQLTSKADFDSCSNSSASTTITTTPASITLTTPGENFFICTFPNHCLLGQKLAVNVTGTPAATSPSGRNVPPSSPTAPGISTPPSPTSAANVVFAALPITFLSVVFALFY